jgi:uncharacterized membrane protein
MMPRRKLIQTAAALACSGAYLTASYFAAAADTPTLGGTLLGILPFALATFALAWNSHLRSIALALFAVAIGLTIVCFDFLRAHASWLYFVQNAGVLAALGVTFGATLWGSDEKALCSRIAVVLKGHKASPELLRYTWHVTLAWTIFFFTCALVSAMLFAWAPLETWSAFANLGTPILLGAMFLGEYWVRLRAIPAHAHIGFQAIVDAYRDQIRRAKAR